jgi:AmmeMemoRadiSam system protein B/AmmeMemoRadiSam system protein A
MKKTLVILSLLLALRIAAAPPARGDAKAGARKPAVAGQFYPADRAKLSRAVAAYLEDALPPSGERPIAIVSPHAGYVFSGQIAADAYKEAAGFEYETVVILGVNHTTPGFDAISVYPSGGFETPLGVAPVDEDLAARVMAADKRFAFDGRVHEREHSIEVQVPFVQTVFPRAKILPVVVGSQDADLCARFGEALAAAAAGKKILIVASSDLSHYPRYEDAVRVDRETLEAIASLDAAKYQAVTARQMQEPTPNLETCACGEGPTLAAMAAAKKLGANRARIVSYANSGSTLVGDRSQVVGYGAVSFVARGRAALPVPATAPEPPGERVATGDDTGFAADQKNALLRFARETLRRYFDTGTLPLPRGYDAALGRKSGAFVTLEENGDLRGCIGHMSEDLPLYQVVGYCALQSAFNDRRFSPLEPDELSSVEIEISVLTPYKRVEGYEVIQIGRDGVVMEKDGRSAVFLPQVAVEQGWTRDEMLEHLSLKAGLPRDAWKKGAVFRTFQAEVFGESEHREKPR